jgi:hypothetical protein
MSVPNPEETEHFMYHQKNKDKRCEICMNQPKQSGLAKLKSLGIIHIKLLRK